MVDSLTDMIKFAVGIKQSQPKTSFMSSRLSSPEQANDTVGLADVSSSMARRDIWPSRVAAAQQSYCEFVQTRSRLSETDRMAVIAFNHTADVVLGLTSILEKATIIEAIERLPIGGGTSLKAGLRAAEKVFFKDGPTANGRLRRILLLTDGHGGTAIRLAQKLQQSGILIEVIGIGGDPSEVNEPLLKKIATTDAAGLTHYWFIKDAAGMVQRFHELATGLVVRESEDD